MTEAGEPRRRPVATAADARIWLAEADEAQTVARLLIAFRDDLGYHSPGDELFHAVAPRLIDDPSTEFLLGAAHPGAQAVGIVQLRYRLSIWHDGGDCLVEDVYVEPHARGAGLGRGLVKAALARARERGCSRAELDVNEANGPAVALYESLGFGVKGPHGGRDLYLHRLLDRP
ncbi:MAG: GNAT family N-acetyltransferase [Solirubrobacteraceae bacterium]|nr:GNAT family N-acetyltransferase [Solirubrobacteraceae bacterium]